MIVVFSDCVVLLWDCMRERERESCECGEGDGDGGLVWEF